MADEVLERIVRALHELHGRDVVALDMSGMPLTMDIFLIATAENRIQARAMADSVQRAAKETGLSRHHVEGYDEGSWILIDLIELVVHIFLPDRRAYYALEMLWSDVPRLDFPDEGDEAT